MGQVSSWRTDTVRSRLLALDQPVLQARQQTGWAALRLDLPDETRNTLPAGATAGTVRILQDPLALFKMLKEQVIFLATLIPSEHLFGCQ
jgi:hypothetical protein